MVGSPLANIPGELRNRIYSMVLVDPDAVSNCRPDDFDSNNRWEAPALLQTCRPIHEKAGSIYYGLDCFEFKGPTQLHLNPAERKRKVRKYTGLQRPHTLPSEDWVVISAWLMLLGRKTNSSLRELQLSDFIYMIEEVDERLLRCRKHLQKKACSIPLARITVDLL